MNQIFKTKPRKDIEQETLTELKTDVKMSNAVFIQWCGPPTQHLPEEQPRTLYKIHREPPRVFQRGNTSVVWRKIHKTLI